MFTMIHGDLRYDDENMTAERSCGPCAFSPATILSLRLTLGIHGDIMATRRFHCDTRSVVKMASPALRKRTPDQDWWVKGVDN